MCYNGNNPLCCTPPNNDVKFEENYRKVDSVLLTVQSENENTSEVHMFMIVVGLNKIVGIIF